MTLENMRHVKLLMRHFERKYFQAYVKVEFCSSSLTWGTITYRYEMSGGPNGTMEFRSSDDLIEKLTWLIEKDFSG